MADRVSLLIDLAPEFFTAETDEILFRLSEVIFLRLVLEHLNLTLQSSAIITPRAFEVMVHPLNVVHEIGKAGPLHYERPVFLHEAAMNTLKLAQRTVI